MNVFIWKTGGLKRGPITKILSILQNLDPQQVVAESTSELTVSTWGFTTIYPGPTKIDALKHYLMQQQEVDEKEIDTLNEMVQQDAYDSDALFGASTALSTRLRCNNMVQSWGEQERSMSFISLF